MTKNSIFFANVHFYLNYTFVDLKLTYFWKKLFNNSKTEQFRISDLFCSFNISKKEFYFFT